jgi:RecA-family ATPase
LGPTSEEYEAISSKSDFYVQDSKNQYLIFKKQELVLKLDFTQAANFSEMYYTVSSTLDNYSTEIDTIIRQAEHLYMCREFDTLRLILRFNKQEELCDQSEFYFPGLK